MNKSNLIIGGVIVLLLLTIGGWSGWSLHKSLRPCPIITTDTVTISDTNTYNLKDSFNLVIGNLQDQVNYWKRHRDTIELKGDSIPYPRAVDTVAILHDYYNKYYYGWSKRDSNITVRDSVVITQNTPVWHNLTYKLNRPFTTIINNVDNSITYNKYFYFGTAMPVYPFKADSVSSNINYIKLEVVYAFPKGYIRGGWQPYTNTYELGVGVPLFKFKQKK